MAYSSSSIVSISSPHVDADTRQPTAIELPPIPAPSASPSYLQKIIAEVLGTYILMFAGIGAGLVDREKSLTVVGTALVPGLALMALIYTVGHISGAHFNPAVTIALAVVRKFPAIHVPMYVLSQMLGSTLACLTLRALFRREANVATLMLTQPAAISDGEAVVWETIVTFILVFTICGAASDDTPNNELCGVAIGGTLALNILVAGPITGASMNPARSLPAALVSGVYKKQWVYVVGPIFGAVAASLVYSLLRPSKLGKHAKAIFNELYVSR